MNVAIISPSQNAYSETFIQAHKNIQGNIFFYYGGNIPEYLEGYGKICIKLTLVNRIKTYLIRKLFLKHFSIYEIQLIRSFKKNKIEIIFAEYGHVGAGLVPLCKKINIPIVTIFHGYDATAKYMIEKYSSMYSELFSYAGKIIVVSELMKNKIVLLGCPANKIIITQCAPNDKFIGIKPTFSEPKSFIAIGRFVDKKAPYYTILAIKKVVLKYPDVKLYFGGNGDLYNTTINLIRYFKLEKNVILFGVITPEEYISLLSKVTGFIQHSITAEDGDMEGTPVSILEASAAGIPVIATRHAGIPEVIIENKTGFLVDEHDVDGMAEQIIKLIENPELAKKMGKSGKENIRNNFSMKKHLDIVKTTLESVIENSKKYISEI